MLAWKRAATRVRFTCLVLIALWVVSLPASGAVTEDVHQAERQRLELLVEEVQPVVADLTGMPEGKPVKVVVKTRSEFKQYLVDLVEVEYPDEELVRRGRCLGMIGLLPDDYDLEAGLVDLVGQEGGGLYDPRTKAFTGIADLPPTLRTPMYQNLIASHELTHALQDRVIDIVSESEVALGNLDYEYAFRATIEGMATVVMIAYTQDLPLDHLPDPRVYMRSGFAQKDLTHFPFYLREVMISPYAEGGVFVQKWLEANSHMKLVSLFDKVPASSEQILHPEKYMDGDEPTPIDMSALRTTVPETWDLYYTNTLGEFDLLTLFRSYAATRADAAGAAAGWDGCRFEAYSDENQDLVIIGSSVWDSERDAEEFHSAFSEVLGEVTEAGRFSVTRSGEFVDFVIGPTDIGIRERILKTLHEAN